MKTTRIAKRHVKMDATLAEAMADLVQTNHQLLIALANATASNEQVQRKFRSGVFIRLAKIEAMLTEVLGAQLVEFWHPDKMSDERRNQYMKEVQERIDRASERLGMEMLRYIYSEPPRAKPPRDRRRKWTGWEI